MPNLSKALTMKERVKIERLLKEPLSLTQIAKQIGRSKNCVVTEVRINGGRENYTANKAQERFYTVHVLAWEELRKRNKGTDPRSKQNIKIENLEMQLEILHDEIKRLRKTDEE